MTTMKIPSDQNDGRVDFKIKDKEGKEEKISLRIEKIEDRNRNIMELIVFSILISPHKYEFAQI